MKSVHWPLMGETLHLVQQGWDWAGPQSPGPLLAVPNVTGHPSTASVPITVLLYNGPLLCGFNVPLKGQPNTTEKCPLRGSNWNGKNQGNRLYEAEDRFEGRPGGGVILNLLGSSSFFSILKMFLYQKAIH